MTSSKKLLKDYFTEDFHTPNTKEVREYLENNFLVCRWEWWHNDDKFITSQNTRDFTECTEFLTTNHEDGDFIDTETFKERIGMTTKEDSTEFPTLEAGKHIVRIDNKKWGYYLANEIVVWVNYFGQSGHGWDRYGDVKQDITHVYLVEKEIYSSPEIGGSKCIWDATKVKSDNIRKELEFAEAKKERLEKHIEVLKSKLQ